MTADAKEPQPTASAATSTSRNNAPDEKPAQDAAAPPTTQPSSPPDAAAAESHVGQASGGDGGGGLSVTIPAPRSHDDDDAAPGAAAPSPTISKSPTGAYVNPAMRRMLESQNAARQRKKAGGGGFGSFLFGGGGGSGNGPRRCSKKGQEGAADDDSNACAKDQTTKEGDSSSSPSDIGRSSGEEDDTDAAYEHGLRPGDHVYRWSHFGYTYPIQIHGIVLETSDASSEGEGSSDGADEVASGDDTNNQAKEDECEEAASLTPPAPKWRKIVSVTIADFGFTRKGDEDNNDGDGVEGGDDADAGSDDAAEQTLAKRHRHQEHADGTATAPASLHPSTNDLEGQNADDTDVRSGAHVDADANADETQPKDSEDTIGDTTDITSAAATSTCTNGEEPTDNNNKSNDKPPRPKSLKKSEESFLAQHLKKGKRLNVITLTDPKDIKKWRKVNYGGKGLFGGDGGDDDVDTKDNKTREGKGKEDTGRGENSDENATSKKEAGGNRFTSLLRSNPSSRCTSPTNTDSEAGNDNTAAGGPIGVQATPSTDFGQLDITTSEQGYQSAPSLSDTQEAKPSPSEEISERPSTLPSTNEANPEKTEAKTLKEMVAAANAVELKARQSPRRKASKDATEAEPSGEQDEADKTVRKSSSLANIWPFKKTGDAKDTSEETSDGDKSNKQSDPSTASKSDPAKIVLARVRFLLENEDNVLPAYHVFNSNSECIAVWCKTGRWSSLQSDVFWHTTAIGNAKSTTLMGLSLAATQPWLIPALPVAAVAAIGTPYLVLRQSKKKCEEATRQLTEGFWAQADPEVYVEAIETWSGIPA